MLPPAAGDYVLGVRGPRPFMAVDAGGSNAPPLPQADRIRLYVDDKLVMDSHSNPANARLSFADTQPHDLRVEYVHSPNDRMVDLEWIPPANSLLGEAIQRQRTPMPSSHLSDSRPILRAKR